MNLTATYLEWRTMRYLTTAQAAQVAHVKPATIRKWSQRGLLHGHRVHDGFRVHKVYAELDVLRAEQQRRAAGGGSLRNGAR